MSFSFLLSLSANVNAQDLAGEDPSIEDVGLASVVSVDDLTEEQFTELASLSVSLRSAVGVSSSSGNITNDVATILTILQSVARYGTSTGNYIYTYPVFNTAGQNIGGFLGQALMDNGAASASASAGQHSFLRLIYDRILDSSFTNAVLSEIQQANVSLDYVLGSLQDLYQESSSQTYHLSDIYNLLYSSGYDALLSSILESQNSFTNWIDDFEYGHGSQWAVHLDDMQLGDILAAIHDSAAVQTNSNSGPQETIEDIRDSLASIQELLFDVAFYSEQIHNVDLEYDETERSVRRDFGYWNATNQTRSVAVDLASIIESLQATASGSYTQLTNEVETAYAGAEDLSSNPTNPPLPSYEDLISGNDSGAGAALQSGASSFSSQVGSLSGMLDGSSNDEIVVIPEMTIGGIHVSQRTAHLTTSVTPVARRIMVFIWGCCLFASLFSLASSEWAFYANLGRNWVKSGGFIYGPSDEG